MKVTKCPTCRQKGGFLTFRKVRKWIRPYVGHYDPTKYQKQKDDYKKGFRKSSPTGRKWCSITKDEAKKLDFEDDWYNEYMESISTIYQKYKKTGFRNLNYVRDMIPLGKGMHGISFRRCLSEFINHPEWSRDWNRATNILKMNGFAEEFLTDKIRYDLFWKTDENENLHDEILCRIIMA